MFALMNLDGGLGPVISFAAGGEHAAELCEREDLFPAPYLARAGWVAAQRWNALRGREWEEEFDAARMLVFGKLPSRTRAMLAMPAKERERLTAERRQVLAQQAKTKRR